MHQKEKNLLDVSKHRYDKYRTDMYSFRTPQKKSYFYPVRTNPHPSQYII